jgi:hypothetical protein
MTLFQVNFVSNEASGLLSSILQEIEGTQSVKHLGKNNICA